MAKGPKQRRIRDPVRDLIQFRADEFERQCWAVVEARPLQRLRRIKQLGFSELVYPGATHSRLAHSLGVYHTAQKLAVVLNAQIGKAFDERSAQVAVAAALVHDIGHGPFSHAFEAALRALKMGVRHEVWTERLIRETEVRKALEDFTPGFANRVASIFRNKGPADIYSSIVASQFDADRLDYMRRDRLMTGTQQGAIDFTWLLDNLKVHRVSVGQDGVFIKEAETFVLGPKAIAGAEAYVLGLFQLYPSVYLHKATRGAEKIFTALLLELFPLAQDKEQHLRTGLPNSHPLIRFAREPTNLDGYLALDDSVVWGALAMLSGASNRVVAALADRLLCRRLFITVNVSAMIDRHVNAKIPLEADESKRIARTAERREEARRCDAVIRDRVRGADLLKNDETGPIILEDVVDRNPYKRVDSDDATALGLVREQVETAAWGGWYSIYVYQSGAAPASNAARQSLLKIAAEADPVDLELAVTAAFLAASGNSRPWREVKLRKPSKATAQRLDSAKALYKRFRSVRAPQHLPAI